MAGRVRHAIDMKALEKYIDQNVPEIEVPLKVKQFGFGQSNPTYQLISPDAAHQVEREHRIIAALGPTEVPVPKAYCLCEYESVIGTPFYIMEFLDGRIFEDLPVPNVSAEERTNLYRAAVHTLAKFHAVDYKKVGLDTYGKTGNFYDRQLATWKQICNAQSKAVDVDTKEPIGSIPHFEEILQFFEDKSRQPRDRSSLVRGDYKLDNMVFHKTEARVIGILDWEMSTSASSSYNNTQAFAPGATPGLPTPDMIRGWYKEVAGWDPGVEMPWALAFNAFRAAAICQGIAARYTTRQVSNAEAQKYAPAFIPLGNLAWSVVEQEMAKSKGCHARL
ncbi:acyl-CoA dehydrogenase family member 11 [Xylariaceae sp. FL1272]|nr:acyl-CoA dehydrogenase family member 11 [Xylariaceae sp. FL1272]